VNWINHPLVNQLGLALVHFIWQGALVGALYALSLPLTRKASAHTRYAIAVITLAVLAAAPPITFALLMTSAAGAAPEAAASGLAPVMLTLSAGGTTTAPAWPWMSWVVGAWLVGVALLSLRLVLGWRFLRRLRREADHEAAARLAGMLGALLQRLDIRRPVALAVSQGVRSPIVIGWLKPLVLLPPAIVAGLPARQLEMVLAHELAHVRRFDHLVNLFQTAVETALFYHPVVRWVSRRIRVERENACDDLAVAVTADRLAYIEMLAALEKLRFEGPRLALAMHDGQVLSRIRRLVEQGGPGRQIGVTVPVLMGGILLAAAVGLQLVPESTLEEAATPPPQARHEALSSTNADVTPSAIEPLPVEPVPSDPVAADPVPAEATTAIAEESEPTPAPSTAEADRAAQGESAPPATPRLETDRLPPAADLLTDPDSVQLALVERPALAIPSLPEPRPAPSPATRAPEITGGELIERIEPDYPIGARQRGVDGSVEVEFLVTRDGRVGEIQVIDEQPRGMEFGEAASEAISRWRFEPFREDDAPIERLVSLEVAFNVDQVPDCKSQLGSRIPRC
jgi:TonB family protein